LPLQSAAVGHHDADPPIGLRDPPHLRQRAVRIQSVLKYADAGQAIEEAVGIAEFLGAAQNDMSS
jgi:hypothetical protein